VEKMTIIAAFADELSKTAVSLGWVRKMVSRGALKRSKKQLAKPLHRLSNKELKLGARRKDAESARAGLRGSGYSHVPPEARLKAEMRLTSKADRLTSQEAKTRAAADVIRKVLGRAAPTG
jgi:hypothetical protein